MAHPAKRLTGSAALVPVIALAAGLGGCVQVQQGLDRIQPPPVNPSSPIAGYAEQVSHETFPTPLFKDVPPRPTEVRTPDQYKDAIVGEIAMRRELAAWRAEHPDLPNDVEGWADLQRQRIPTRNATPVSQTHDVEAEAFAKRLREEAAKSPPPQQ